MTEKSSYPPKKYSLGLDIGTSSVGWAVLDLDKERIHDLGVRIFERPEDPQNGDSLAKPRRDARSARHRLKRRRQRLNHLKQFFIDQNILTKDQVEKVLDYKSDFNKLDVYELRAKALAEELSPEELLKVLYQIAKRRGFKSNRKVVEESDKEGGRVTRALKTNEKFLADNNYTTVGDALSRDEKFALHKRNKRDDYTNSFTRDDFLRELEAITKTQRSYALKNIPEQAINELIYGIDDGQVTNVSAIMYQRPFMTKELIEKMVGDCTFEKDEKRAPKASYSFEVFRLASDLSHLVFIPRDASKRQAKRENLEVRLSSEQINKVIDLAKNQKSLTYKKVRNTAGISEDYAPKDVRGKKKEGDEFGEDNTFGGLKAYNDIRLALKDLPEDWAKIDNESAINQIAYILTTQKADESIQAELDSLPLSDKAKEAIVKIKPTNFKAFGHLSIKALQKITPHILEGMTYDKACETAGYDFKKQSASLEQITNPVVKRAVTQTLKVVRAIERKYGKPYFIKVETARDLAKNFKDRKAIENENKENQARNQSIIQTLNENGVVTPTGQQIIKVKLYREQNGVCLYSGKSIDFETMLRDDNAYQVDHIVPFSRSNNDGITNKTLVLTEENQKKGDQTPFEYFGADEKRWKEFAARVESIYKTRDIKTSDKATNAINYKYNGYAMKKKQNLLLQDYKNDSWNVRALNDTRYITRFIQNYLRQNVDFAEGEEKQRVIAPNGTTTAYLRKRWGLAKDRAEDVLHHAKDAAVVAAIDNSIVRQANLFAKRGEIAALLSAVKTMEEKTDKLTGEIIDGDEFDKAQQRKDAAIVLTSKYFPQPWDNFGKEVMKRTLNTDIATLQNELRGLDNYDEDFRLSVKPIFVSRMPRRKAAAQAHKETIRSPKVKDNDQRTVRMPLNKVKRKDVENSVLKESDKWLYDKLLERLNAHDNNPEKAFTEPIYKNDKKFDKNGKQLSPVSTIKVYSTQPSGFYINDGKAFVNNGSMVWIDVYQKPNKKGKIEHFFVPVYAHQVGKNKPAPTKILPAPKGFTDVDETFTKVCSLYPNDYVRCYFGNEIKEGYYVKYGINNGAMQVIAHSTASKDKDHLIQISPRSANLIERYDIAILGDNYRWL
ncbi:type II CRISPR RNA-guided endonuclease Cas9 [Candidatus Saccharibacteria bacterium oral taxon 955]|nr:type II CRISPR RNA-guided endonuclease Cas9 [Candidatus Saccharibacteria bacterium oral taxon 955]QJU05721.1 type II CRISPR RNA-guided endonuclease Cas9 [Candidatus Saccharibacteria bacterium oral taxon 955]